MHSQWPLSLTPPEAEELPDWRLPPRSYLKGGLLVKEGLRGTVFKTEVMTWGQKTGTLALPESVGGSHFGDKQAKTWRV